MKSYNKVCRLKTKNWRTLGQGVDDMMHKIKSTTGLRFEGIVIEYDVETQEYLICGGAVSN